MREALKRAQDSGYIVKDGKLEHRSVWRRAHGRIPKGWVVHHINEDKTDNRLENLIAMPNKMHTELHKTQYKTKTRFSKQQIESMLGAIQSTHKDLLVELDKAQAYVEQVMKEIYLLGVNALRESQGEHPLLYQVPKERPKALTPAVKVRKEPRPDVTNLPAYARPPKEKSLEGIKTYDDIWKSNGKGGLCRKEQADGAVPSKPVMLSKRQRKKAAAKLKKAQESNHA